ncbi:MAG: hypothetical protein ACI832_000167 [Rheinheimera aquimaris]|jgi:hypothetical protein|tara:strand:- start:587 stop:1084 length:498 start_codon:yes stop_codon:yes gene_type:complete
MDKETIVKKVITFLLLSLFSVSAGADTVLSEEQLKDLTQQFIAAKNARQQPDSTAKDVEYFLSFLAEEFLDDHVKFNVIVSSKEELRERMLAKLKDKILFSNIDILEIMTGRNVTFVKFKEHVKEHVKGQPGHMDKPIEYTAVNIMSLEFNDNGKIKHIRRHHGL